MGMITDRVGPLLIPPAAAIKLIAPLGPRNSTSDDQRTYHGTTTYRSGYADCVNSASYSLDTSGECGIIKPITGDSAGFGVNFRGKKFESVNLGFKHHPH